MWLQKCWVGAWRELLWYQLGIITRSEEEEKVHQEERVEEEAVETFENYDSDEWI